MLSKIVKILGLLSVFSLNSTSAGNPDFPCFNTVVAYDKARSDFNKKMAEIAHNAGDAIIDYDATHKDAKDEVYETEIKDIAAPFLEAMTAEKNRFIGEDVPDVFDVSQSEAYDYFVLFQPAEFPLNCVYRRGIYEAYQARHRSVVDYMSFLIKEHKENYSK